MNVSESILRTLAYFDVFNYPLSTKEIYTFLTSESSEFQVNKALSIMVANGVLSTDNKFYSIRKDDTAFEKRKTDNDRADLAMPEAIANGEKIRKFPFVRDVFLSGSISKGVMKKDSDIDYFIVGSEGRIWICKLFLKFYKLFILKNQKESFCINYFISTNNLTIDEQNMFTAVELISLIPLTQSGYKIKLLEQNDWVKEILPQGYKECMQHTVSLNGRSERRFGERFFVGKLGDFFDGFIKNLITAKNKRKYESLQKSKDYELMTRSTDDQIKVHDSNHQRVILDLYSKKLDKIDLELKFVTIDA